MKKLLKIFLWVNAAALFILNLGIQMDLLDAEFLQLSAQQEQAFADECGGDDCGITPGPSLGTDPIEGDCPSTSTYSSYTWCGIDGNGCVAIDCAGEVQ